MELLGLLILIISSWYILKLISNFMDEPTKQSLSKEFKIIQKKFVDINKILSKKFLFKAWERYKEEDGVFAKKEGN